MKLTKKLLCLLAALCILFSLLPTAHAEVADDERFKDKTWDEIVDAFFAEHSTGPGFITLATITPSPARNTITTATNT